MNLIPFGNRVGLKGYYNVQACFSFLMLFCSRRDDQHLHRCGKPTSAAPGTVTRWGQAPQRRRDLMITGSTARMGGSEFRPAPTACRLSAPTGCAPGRHTAALCFAVGPLPHAWQQHAKQAFYPKRSFTRGTTIDVIGATSCTTEPRSEPLRLRLRRCACRLRREHSTMPYILH